MSGTSKYESRIGVVKQSSSTIFNFITDMRNFHQFIPGDKISNWKAEKESCEFELSPIGRAKLKIFESEPHSLVKYEGDGLNNTVFYLWVQIKEVSEADSRVKITIKADLNPMIKMMATKPINDFLEKLITGLETFNGWESAG